MTIFSRIIAGEIPSYKCAEDDRFYAFLDINPVVQGHTLVVPKHEVDYIFDLSDEELAAMTLFAKRVAAAIKTAFPCKKVGMAVLGLEVNHAHIHLIPLQSEGDMDFRKPKLQFSSEVMADTADRILKAFAEVKTWAEPEKKGRRVYDDKEFYESLAKQRATGRILSPKQSAALMKLAAKYKIS